MGSRTPAFLRFALVGVIGFVADAGALGLAMAAGLGLYAGRLCSYLVAATVTWWLNRSVTFRSKAPPSVREWLRFLAANAVGGGVNLGAYTALVLASDFVRANPVLGVAVGSLLGLNVNFVLSRTFVFGHATSDPARREHGDG